MALITLFRFTLVPTQAPTKKGIKYYVKLFIGNTQQILKVKSQIKYINTMYLIFTFLSISYPPINLAIIELTVAIK